jgi:hypothetical protein
MGILDTLLKKAAGTSAPKVSAPPAPKVPTPPPAPQGWGSVGTATAETPPLPAEPPAWTAFRAKLKQARIDREVADKAEFLRKAEEYEKWATDGAKGDPPSVQSAPVSQEPAEISFRDMASRWYDNVPGGFDAAVTGSQESLARTRLQWPGLLRGTYGDWTPFDLDSPAEVLLQDLAPSVRGDFLPGTSRVRLNERPETLPGAAERGVLEHELTHYMTDDGSGMSPDARGPFFRRPHRVVDNDGVMRDVWRSEDFEVLRPILTQRAESLAKANLDGGRGGTIEFHDSDPVMRQAAYLTERVEVDPRLADIRRRYAHTFGRDVQTVEDAQKAWDWWRKSQNAWAEAPNDRPTIDRAAFGLYDSLPDYAKQALLVRMTQVPAVMAPIAAGGGVLSGLAPRNEESR